MREGRNVPFPMWSNFILLRPPFEATAKSQDLRKFIVALAVPCHGEGNVAKIEIPVTFGTGGSWH